MKKHIIHSLAATKFKKIDTIMKTSRARSRLNQIALAVALVSIMTISLGACSGGGDSEGGGTLDINLWMVAIPDYQGTSDPVLGAIVNECVRILQGAGISIGDLRVGVLNDAVAQRLTFLDIEKDGNRDGWPDELGELFALSSLSGNDSLDVFFVRSIGTFGILGISGGIPGPSDKGTAFSGVVVSTFGGLSRMSTADQLLQGATMAHEGSHYLGLFHTTERTGLQFDPISDTPECPRGVFDGNGDRIVSASECRGQDGPNLMFWAAGNYVQEVVTGGQLGVLNRHPFID